MKERSETISVPPLRAFTAAHNPAGLPRLLFDLGRDQVVALISSHLAVDEAPTLDPPVAQLEIVGTASLAAPLLDLPDDDQLIFGAALVARATQLLTGDKKHFGAISTIRAGPAGSGFRRSGPSFLIGLD